MKTTSSPRSWAYGWPELKSGRQLTRGAGVALGIHVIGAASAYAMEIVLARAAGPDEYGIYSFVYSGVALLAIPVSLGLTTALLRYVGVYAASGEVALLRGIVLRSWQLVSLAAVLVGIAIAVAVSALGAPGSIPVRTLLLGLALLPILALQDVQTSIGRGLRRMVVAFAPKRVGFPLLVIGGVALLAATGVEVDASRAIGIAVAAGALVVVIQAGLIGATVFRVAAGPSPAYRTTEWLRTSLPMLLIAGFMFMLARTDVLMLGLLAAPSEVGIYNAATRTAHFALLGLTAVNAVAAPMIADLWARRDTDELQRLASTVAHLVFWPAVLVVIGLVALGPRILGVFGAQFSAGHTALAILAIAQLFNVGVGSVGYFMNMTGHHRYMALIVGSAAALNVGLNWVAIPRYGIEGAAVATAISLAFWNLTLERAIVRRLGIRPSIVSAVWRARTR